MELEEDAPYREEDFDLIAEWGFDFVRLPLDYRIWTVSLEPLRVREKPLKEIDQAVAWGRKRRIHVSLNFHRAPGYCVNAPPEKLNLWKDEKAQKACARQWAMLARRYKGIPGAELSFNLINEPTEVDAEGYRRVIRRLAEAIRAEDPRRLIIVDGLEMSSEPVPGLEDLGVAQSLHAYDPFEVSTYRAPWWEETMSWPKPSWPLVRGGKRKDKAYLRKRLARWKVLASRGTGVHIGEIGVYNQTPHAVALDWLEDNLALFQEVGLGWAVWNLRGPSGPLDSGRKDVAYEEFRGRKLDRKMLELLRRYAPK